MSIAEKLQAVAENQQRVYDSGQQEEYDRFWDAYQQNGTRTDYQQGFSGKGWNNKTFQPKYDIAPTWGGGTSIFRQIGFNGNLKEHLNNMGVKVDFSKLSTLTYAFSEAAGVTEVPDLDLSNSTQFAYAFYNCTSLTTAKIRLSEKLTSLTHSFNNCTALENLTVEGVIACNMDIHWSPLTKASLESIIHALADKSTDTSADWTVTFGATNLAKLTDAEKAIATEKGWTLV